MRNTVNQETELVGQAKQSILKLLPDSWAITERLVGDRAEDLLLELISPGGKRVPFRVQAKRSGAVPAAGLLASLSELKQSSSVPVLFVSDYIGPRLRTGLTQAGISFADATGWVGLTSEDPMVMIAGRGAEKSPTPSRPGALSRLDGVAASRTIRALADEPFPIGVRDLAALAGSSPSSVSKLLATLAAEGVVDRDDWGWVDTVRQRALIRRWTADYSFTRTNKPVRHYIAPRGVDRAVARLAGASEPVALTASAASRRLLPEGMTPVVPLRLLALYAFSPSNIAGEIGLIEADESSANVVIAVPQDPQILAEGDGGLGLAPVSLVLADLLTLPNRSEAEAEQLMGVLEMSYPTWKEAT